MSKEKAFLFFEMSFLYTVNLGYVTRCIGRFIKDHGTVAVTDNLSSIIGYIKLFDYANVVLFSVSGMFTQLCAI